MFCTQTARRAQVDLSLTMETMSRGTLKCSMVEASTKPPAGRRIVWAIQPLTDLRQLARAREA